MCVLSYSVKKRCIRESEFRPAGTILDHAGSIFKDAYYTSYTHQESS